MRFKDKVKADDNRKRAFTYLTQNKGLEPHIAAGILGNFMQEAGQNLNVEAYNPNDLGKPSFGLAQWRGDRMTQLKKVAGEKASTLEGQLDFMMWEFENTEKRAFKKVSEASTTEEAALAFSQYYERPHKNYAHNEKRVKYAKSLFNTYVGENEDGWDTKDLGVEEEFEFQPQPQEEAVAQDQQYNYSGYQQPQHNSGQVYLGEEGEQAQVQDNAQAVQTPILDAAVSRIEGKKAEMAMLQQIMKANEVQYIDPNESADPQPNSYGYPSMEEGGETDPKDPRPLTEEDSVIQTYGIFGQKPVAPPVKLREVPKRKGRATPEPLNLAVRETTAVRRDTTNPLLTPFAEKESPESFEEIMEDVNNPVTDKQILQEKIKSKSEFLNPLGYDKIDPKSLQSEEDVARIQAQLVENGYELGEVDGKMGSKTLAAIDKFNTKLDLTEEISIGDFKSPDKIKELQEFLIAKDYDLNPNGKFKDDGVDGKLGEVTQKAILDYNKKVAKDALPYKSVKEGVDLLGECTEKQCSEYVQNEIWRNLQPQMSRTEWNKTTGLHGDAWDIGNNIIKAGGREIKINKVSSGDIVTIQTEGSDYRGEAGSNITHTAVVDQVNADGSYYILHNVHKKDAKGEWQGREFRDLVNPDSGKVTGRWKSFNVAHAYRPVIDGTGAGKATKPLRKDVALAIDPEQMGRLENISSVIGSAPEKIKTFIEPLNNFRNKEKFSQIFGLEEDEYQSLAQLTIGILGQESNFGTSPKALVKEVGATASKMVNIATWGQIDSPYIKKDEVSHGAGQLKYNTNFHSDLTEFGITKKNFDDDKNAPITSMYKLATDYKKFLKKGYSKKDAIYRAAAVYNASLSGESQGKSREEWAKDYDVDYANKAITFAGALTAQGEEKQYKTLIDDLLVEDNVLKWKDATYTGRNR